MNTPLLLVFERASLLREELQHGGPLLGRRRRGSVGFRHEAHGDGRREAPGGAAAALLLHVLPQQAARHREPAAGRPLLLGGHDDRCSDPRSLDGLISSY